MVAIGLVSLLACTTDPAISDSQAGGSGGSGGSCGSGGQGGKPDFMPPAGGAGGGGTGGTGAVGPSPSEFTPVEVGGWKRGDPLLPGMTDPGLVGDGKTCNMIVGVVRDFRVRP